MNRKIDVDCARCRAWETCAPGWCSVKFCSCGPGEPNPHPRLAREISGEPKPAEEVR